MLLIGSIADDITGASDLGLMLASNGMPTTLIMGVPDDDRVISTPAVVIALKIRTCTSADAVQQASAAARWLQQHAVRQIYYKYCSTFDSTAAGNIGPVTQALMTHCDVASTVLLPAFPDNGRTLRDGTLLVDGLPLADSPMRHHPLTPMTESFVPQLMDAQTSAGQSTYIGMEIVSEGHQAIGRELCNLQQRGYSYICIDTCSNKDLKAIADAIVDMPLITGGSGIGAALPGSLRRRGLLAPSLKTIPLPAIAGNAAILAGSCSEATRRQVAAFANFDTAIRIDPEKIASGTMSTDDICNNAQAAADKGNVLVYSSSDPGLLRETQQSLGVQASADLVEKTLASVARRLADNGVRKFIVAGGETSGAVARALAIDELEVSEQIDPGVPWMVTRGTQPTCIAFKSGNFGRPDFFRHALELLP